MVEPRGTSAHLPPGDWCECWFRIALVVLFLKKILRSALGAAFEVISYEKAPSWVWWHTPVIPTLGKLRREVCHKLEASLGYIVPG